ncbi:MAG: hypothetical protein IJM30_03805 [Thermoguttaceae bacterium]|nr:hypothetical protein [Thermoguttaceae bacterium]
MSNEKQVRGKAFLALLAAATDYQENETPIARDYRWNVAKVVEALDFECDDAERDKFEQIAADAARGDWGSGDYMFLEIWIEDLLKRVEIPAKYEPAALEILERAESILAD